MTMHKILIKGNVPYLMDEPIEPAVNHTISTEEGTKLWENFFEALTKARESAIPFDRPEEVLSKLCLTEIDPAKFTTGNYAYWKDCLKENDTFPIPDGFKAELKFQVQETPEDEWQEVSRSIQITLRGYAKRIVYSLTPISKPLEQEPCPNCKETKEQCACMRNICMRCGGPVGNITFTVCDKCWDIEHPPVEDIKESKELALKIASGIYLKFHEKHNLSLADCEEMADFVLEHF